MSGPALQHYLKHRTIYEWGMLIALFTFDWLANTTIVIFDYARSGLDVAPWQVATWEGSSALLMIILIPVMLRFDQWFRIEKATLPRNLLFHMLMTVPWSAAHVSGMVLVRKFIYGLHGEQYVFSPVLREFGYEFLKDFRSYFTILAVIYLYRFVLLRLQGEAQFLGETSDEETPPAPVTDRFLVKKLGREFLVRVEDIDWIEAAGNYVNLHVGKRLYPLRETMTKIDERLKQAGFIRVHRSAIVNMDRVAEIEPFDTGDARARLTTGAEVPVSRRYRVALKSEFA
ncbi:MAG TPA: LytTR family DNA-binding domain-containing protein [Xanthomonadales bacterium]|nr:LytTR family DNA-binding domain-containing protein [Xanthomonadales bacterium]